MSSSVHELAEKLLQSGAPGLLDTALDLLAQREADADFAEQLLAAHVEGVAHTLREALEHARLDRWVAERCTVREQAAVARGLEAWLGRMGGGGDDADSRVSVPEPPHDPRGLTRWALSHGVEDLLDAPYPPADDLPLGQVCLGQATGTGSLLDAERHASEAREHLRRRAARRLAIEHREARWRAPLPESTLRPLLERLRALLIETLPADLDRVRFVPAHPVQVDTRTAVVRARLREEDASDTVAVRLMLGGYEHGGLVGECRHCGAPRCLHVRALAARLLDAGLAPDDPLHARLEQVATEPSWQRFVRELGRPDPEPEERDKGPAETRVSFRVQTHATGLRVGAYLQKRLGRGVWSTGKLSAPQRLLRREGTEDHDVHVLEAMTRRGITPGPGYVEAEVDLLRALVEHPCVQLEGGGREAPRALRVEEARLQVELRPASGGLVPRISLAGRELPTGTRGSSHVHLLDDGMLAFAPLTPTLRRWLGALDHFRGALPRFGNFAERRLR